MSPNNLKQQLQAIPIPSSLRQRSQLGIEQAIMEKKEVNHRKSIWIKRKLGAIVAALVLLLLSAALMNQNYVWAAIQKALQFVPGIGIVKEEGSSSERYVLKQPISLSVGEGSIIITGILSDEEMTYITMAGNNTPRFEYVTLVNAQGNEYRLGSTIASWSSNDWTSGFWYKGKLDTSGSIKLVINLEPKIEVPVTLTRAETYSSYPEMGETATVNGVSITAIPDRVGDKARVSLVARHTEDFYISDYGIYGVYMHDESHKLNVLDDTGKKLVIENIRGVSSPASEFYFKLSENARNRYSLTLPEISVTYKSEVSIRISTEAKEHINQTFEIAGFPVTITKTEKVKEKGLRVYMDFHYNEQAAASLFNINIEGLSSSAKLNERTGAIEYMEFEVEPGSKQVNLKLIRPGVIIRGPWQFELSEENFKAGNA
ncbi:hypothetical protein EHS13_32935 [Paenibacillus psychroresistens]|uniref:DUF4179 domain-containing protein n=1 Tax=Paenibacillus psychroresistens TaxID=1778678 RepID=A0A6B8RTU4_9BACL|nr:hypothetical protein [Paenibacillus psychroresistens]QGQ99329.1 hypothetical protein EHS13_32935 [Paenibacillus psychroresistens]